MMGDRRAKNKTKQKKTNRADEKKKARTSSPTVQAKGSQGLQKDRRGHGSHYRAAREMPDRAGTPHFSQGKISPRAQLHSLDEVNEVKTTKKKGDGDTSKKGRKKMHRTGSCNHASAAYSRL